ncbi:MAG: response regulator transcription factor [Sulfurospirillaceae bacterium]|nr:response regulator transcription factor [Sulfurospirillaceae bacterium]
MAKSIFIIEDEKDVLELLEYTLQKAGFDTNGATSLKHVEQFLDEEKVDLMIVDRNLQGAEGSEFVAELRKKGVDIPVIFVTAKDKDGDIEEGFLRGGDDYVTKPFNINELILRIKAILARTSKNEEKILVYKDIKMELDTRRVYVENKEVELTRLEFDLLKAFIENKHNVLQRDYLLEHVWKDESFFQDKTVNVAINRLKKKIDPEKNKHYFKSVWGVGYSLC